MKYTYNFFFIIYILLLIVGCDTISYYNSPGAAQVIGTKEKLYVFLQINRQRVSSLKYYDAPSVYPISNTAKLLEVNLDGTYSLKDIILPKKFNLNPNISHLFFYKNNIYFFADVGTRIGDELLLLKLKNELLCEVSIDNKELNTIINDERKRITYVQIDAFSMEQGALFVNVYRNIGEKSIFTWNKQQINISLGEEIDSFSFIIKIEPLLSAPIKVAIPKTPDL